MCIDVNKYLYILLEKRKLGRRIVGWWFGPMHGIHAQRSTLKPKKNVEKHPWPSGVQTHVPSKVISVFGQTKAVCAGGKFVLSRKLAAPCRIITLPDRKLSCKSPIH